VRVHGSPRLYLKPLKLSSFDVLTSMRIRIQLAAFKNNADPCESGSATLLVKTSVYLEEGCPNWSTESLIKISPVDQPKSCKVLK
jgi:hypothetical protein